MLSQPDAPWQDRMASLALPLLDAATVAAARCHSWIGRGDKIAADHAAVEAMRSHLSTVPGHGVVVIGEGEKDNAPMLYAGEEIGCGDGPEFDLAVDPLEGTNLCARGWPGAITVLAAAPRRTFAPIVGFYMDKLVVGPAAHGAIDIEAPIEDNLTNVAAAQGVKVSHLKVAVLAKPRHVELIARIRAMGAGVVEIPDGDVMAGLASLVPGGGIDLSVGIGGAPEGVITACAVRLLGGDMQGKPAPQGDEERQMVSDAGELGRVYMLDDLSESDDGIFVASGVTGSVALPGVTVAADGFHVQSVLITRDQGLLRIGSTVRD
ncbi:MAG TPA: class II fructose-bisphosphatase [Acidimicrobiales bacterium]|jgi:fructose-1,6-bisphosphatase II|nr:class II fructose-bisphosphatase [Acidimicrobiales bacterium]